MSKTVTGRDVAKAALKWVGREFNPGTLAQCMAFTRRALADAGSPLAGLVTEHPVDGHWTGRDLASSLAGRDLGDMVTRIPDLLAGDVVFFDDTYPTGFPAGTITHVGIALGFLDFVHRPTVARPVERSPFAGYWASKFRCALRPKTAAPVPPPATDPEPQRVSAATARVTLDGKLLGEVPLVEGRTALGVVGKLLGHQVRWDAQTKTVALSSKPA